MDYDEIIPVLTKAIQEQQAQIEALRTMSEPRPSGSLDTPPNDEAPVTVVPSTIIRQSVGPSNAALVYVGTAVLVFALVVAWRAPRGRARLGR